MMWLVGTRRRRRGPRWAVKAHQTIKGSFFHGSGWREFVVRADTAEEAARKAFRRMDVREASVRVHAIDDLSLRTFDLSHDTAITEHKT